MEENRETEASPGRFSLLGTASTMGLHMVSGPLVGGGLGWLADTWLDSWPWGAGIGLVLGIAAGFRNVWIDARYLIRSEAQIDGAAKQSERQPGSREAVRPEETVACADKNSSACDLSTASVLCGMIHGEGTSPGLRDETEDDILRILGPEALAGGKPEPDPGTGKSRHVHN